MVSSLEPIEEVAQDFRMLDVALRTSKGYLEEIQAQL